METAYLVIGSHALVIGVLHFAEGKNLIDVNWDFVKIGVMGEIAYSLWKFINKLSMFL